MEHIALYRKYRPKVFEDVLSQDHVSKTLINQIESNRISHAYLFNGPRGTGKTTCAKILSRVVNCLNPIGHNPCNECENCRQILQDSFLDVIEMDAASHNGVDDIRELIDGVRYPPSVGKMKVIIIDEAHMITKGAFNALLKTIEEPPKYMIFIFATTEVNKIPQTIISRCQRFDFKRIEANQMQGYLAEVAEKENIKIDADALLKISKQAAGAMRDALGILERTSSSKESSISESDLDEILGIGFDDIEKLLEALIHYDISEALTISSQMYYAGKDIVGVREELIELLRKAMLYSAGLSNEVAEIKPREEAFLTRINAKRMHRFFVFALGEFIEASRNKSFLNARAEFEYILASICAASPSAKREADNSTLLNEGRVERKRDEKINASEEIMAGEKISASEKARDEDKRFKEELPEEPREARGEEKQDIVKDQSLEEAKTKDDASSELSKRREAKSIEEKQVLINGRSWDEVLASVKEKNPYAHTVICKLNPISYEYGELKASFPKNLKALSVGFESRGLSDILKESVKELCQEDISISIV